MEIQIQNYRAEKLEKILTAEMAAWLTQPSGCNEQNTVLMGFCN